MSVYRIWHSKKSSKKTIKPSEQKQLAQFGHIELGLDVVLACEAFCISRCTYYYQAILVDDTEIIDVLSLLTQKHPRYGY